MLSGTQKAPSIHKIYNELHDIIIRGGAWSITAAPTFYIILGILIPSVPICVMLRMDEQWSRGDSCRTVGSTEPQFLGIDGERGGPRIKEYGNEARSLGAPG